MQEYINVGADVHDKTILVKMALGLAAPEKRCYRNTPEGRSRMVAEFHKRSQNAGGATVVFVYEASGLGFGLYDELAAAGITCHVLAPTRIARSNKQKRDKTDERDAQQLFELVRGHTLAGNALPTVWVPDPQTRDDRELVRARLDAGDKQTAVKTQIRCLLKRNQVVRPEGLGQGWTVPYLRWLWRLAQETSSALKAGARRALETLLRQLEALEREIQAFDEDVAALARTRRYALPARELKALLGVGILTAMVYLTEMGDLSRFRNRRQVGSFLGLVPSKQESGETTDRKGHITQQGPGRVRRVLCQAVWSRLAHDPATMQCHQRIARGNRKRKKIATVALMRRLAILMWHRGLAAQQAGLREASAGTGKIHAAAG